MVQTRVITQIIEKPLECVKGVIAAGFITRGIISLLPNFDIADNQLLRSLHSPVAVRSLGIWLVVLFGIQLAALLNIKHPSSVRVRITTSFLAFCTFFALGFMSFASFGVLNVGWITYAILALIEGIFYIRLKWGIDGHG